tara:strand:- start:871 stop:1056 length:186 start_codon:yes stop_codon:yes gene_type:complete
VKTQFKTSEKNPLGLDNQIILSNGDIIKLISISNNSQWHKLTSHGVWDQISNKELFNLLKK